LSFEYPNHRNLKSKRFNDGTFTDSRRGLVRLEEPFASKDVKWLVAATSRDGRKGRVTPYADPRAYTDRLNQIFTASGWTREYTVDTLYPITRMKKDKPTQTGKVLVTCVVSIPGVGTHSRSGEDWADAENAMTSADPPAQGCRPAGLSLVRAVARSDRPRMTNQA
jgi:hypothetical protein